MPEHPPTPPPEQLVLAEKEPPAEVAKVGSEPQTTPAIKEYAALFNMPSYKEFLRGENKGKGKGKGPGKPKKPEKPGVGHLITPEVVHTAEAFMIDVEFKNGEKPPPAPEPVEPEKPLRTTYGLEANAALPHFPNLGDEVMKKVNLTRFENEIPTGTAPRPSDVERLPKGSRDTLKIVSKGAEGLLETTGQLAARADTLTEVPPSEEDPLKGAAPPPRFAKAPRLKGEPSYSPQSEPPAIDLVRGQGTTVVEDRLVDSFESTDAGDKNKKESFFAKFLRRFGF